MTRKKLPLDSLSESTKKHMTKEDLYERQEQEADIKEAMTSSYIEEYSLKHIKGNKNKRLYSSFQLVLSKLGIFTSVDSITLTHLIRTINKSFEIDKKIKRAGEIGDIDLELKLEKQYLSYISQIDKLYKSLNITPDIRSKLSEMTANCEFVEDVELTQDGVSIK